MLTVRLLTLSPEEVRAERHAVRRRGKWPARVLSLAVATTSEHAATPAATAELSDTGAIRGERARTADPEVYIRREDAIPRLGRPPPLPAGQ